MVTIRESGSGSQYYSSKDPLPLSALGEHDTSHKFAISLGAPAVSEVHHC